MILVIGGVASGKRTYVQSLGFQDAMIAEAVLDDAPVVYGLEELLWDGPLTSEAFETLCSKRVVCCCEVGMGVVPIDAQVRAWRERVGRTCMDLGNYAEKIVRMVCGIPVTIKDLHEEVAS